MTEVLWYVPLMRLATVVASCARAAKVNAVTLKLGMESLTRVCVLTEIGTKHKQHGQFRSNPIEEKCGRKRAYAK